MNSDIISVLISLSILFINDFYAKLMAARLTKILNVLNILNKKEEIVELAADMAEIAGFMSATIALILNSIISFFDKKTVNYVITLIICIFVVFYLITLFINNKQILINRFAKVLINILLISASLSTIYNYTIGHVL